MYLNPNLVKYHPYLQNGLNPGRKTAVCSIDAIKWSYSKINRCFERAGILYRNTKEAISTILYQLIILKVGVYGYKML